jgi:hypothetical protein
MQLEAKIMDPEFINIGYCICNEPVESGRLVTWWTTNTSHPNNWRQIPDWWEFIPDEPQMKLNM